MHPTVPQIMLLSQAFLGNFDPFVKLFRAPTAQMTVSRAATDLETMATNTEALMCVIYLPATVAMKEQQCIQLLETSKSVLVKRFTNAAQQALVNARLTKSTETVVLQALMPYLVRAFIDAARIRSGADICVPASVVCSPQVRGQAGLMDPSGHRGQARRDDRRGQGAEPAVSSTLRGRDAPHVVVSNPPAKRVSRPTRRRWRFGQADLCRTITTATYPRR